MSRLNSMVLRQNWKFKAADSDTWMPAQVPGCVHTDLLRNEVIADPFYGTNERELQWIDKKDWEYTTEFDLSSEQAAHRHAELVFDGLDTYADVFLNGQLILQADNMFRVWRVNVSSQLKPAGNVLLIRFRSPIHEDLPKLEKLGFAYPAPNDDSKTGGLGDRKVSVFARKAPYHYGWDWGPRFVTFGLWRDVRLTCWTGSRLTDVFLRQDDIRAEQAKLTAIVEIESDQVIEGAVVRVSCEAGQWQQAARLSSGMSTVEVEVDIAQPKLWWTRGLGDPYLYEFQVALLDDDGRVIAEQTLKTGLRDIRLVTEPDADGQGATFHFAINGVPIFAKGANHIPNDSFIPEVTRERYRHEIASAVESNMNMLRIWGGGIYEQDDFYELCDEYGILVWQDFMFACSLYPGDGRFLESVRLEAEDNIRRLRNHPCLAVWCGNNEIDSAFAYLSDASGWGWKNQYTAEQNAKLWQDYVAIFHRVLPEAVAKLAPGAAYWPSSPLAADTGDARQHASFEANRGDIHYWGVWHNSEPFENYNDRIARFMSEYGFQSFPEPRTVRTYAEEKDMELLSEVMLSHQKNGRGNALIKEYMEMYMKEPKDFTSFLLMSQALQADGIKLAIEAHRRNMPYCMGTLYWQMNDCWPVASWSSMDYYGRWKALQYTAKRSFQDLAVSIDGTGETVDVYLLNDTLSEVSGKLRIRLFNFDGELYSETSVPAVAAPNAATKAHVLQPEEWLAGRAKDQVVLLVEWIAGDEVLDSKEHYFVSAQMMALTVPNITLKEVHIDGTVHYMLETDRLARYVRLFAEEEGIFTDNNFDLIPGIPRLIGFKARSSGDQPFVPASPGSITIQSMAEWVK